VHISKGIPVENSTKVWITKAGGCMLANNKSKIPQKDLKALFKVINLNYFLIVTKWKEIHDIEEVKFYC